MSSSERPEEVIASLHREVKVERAKIIYSITCKDKRGQTSKEGEKNLKLRKGNKEKRNNQNSNMNKKGETPVKMLVFDKVEAERVLTETTALILSSYQPKSALFLQPISQPSVSRMSGLLTLS